VADVGEQEIEFGPAEPLRDGRQRFLTAPETIFNLGVAKDWEVLQGQAVMLRSLGPAQTSLVAMHYSSKAYCAMACSKTNPSPASQSSSGRCCRASTASPAPVSVGPG
ncbi:MAG TPA: hypothetical protein VN849_07620, partial [Stellaceae bacterium]|nr:hypothetical protein [Stellaceae bacterium]